MPTNHRNNVPYQRPWAKSLKNPKEKQPQTYSGSLTSCEEFPPMCPRKDSIWSVSYLLKEGSMWVNSKLFSRTMPRPHQNIFDKFAWKKQMIYNNYSDTHDWCSQVKILQIKYQTLGPLAKNNTRTTYLFKQKIEKHRKTYRYVILFETATNKKNLHKHQKA